MQDKHAFFMRVLISDFLDLLYSRRFTDWRALLSAESAFFFVAAPAAAKQMRGRALTSDTENPLREATMEPAEGKERREKGETEKQNPEKCK